MRVGKLILRMRHKQARYKARGMQASFGNFVGGSVELAIATAVPVQRDSCFIIPLSEIAQVNKTESTIDQVIQERFAVLVCLVNKSTSIGDAYGIVGYNRIHDIRDEIFGAFLGFQLAEAEGVISFKGGALVDYSRSHLWYSFEFEYPARLLARTLLDDEGDYIEGYLVDYGYQDTDLEKLHNFNKMYTQIVTLPDDKIPLKRGQTIPLPDGFPDVSIPDVADWFDFSEE